MINAKMTRFNIEVPADLAIAVSKAAAVAGMTAEAVINECIGQQVRDRSAPSCISTPRLATLPAVLLLTIAGELWRAKEGRLQYPSPYVNARSRLALAIEPAGIAVDLAHRRVRSPLGRMLPISFMPSTSECVQITATSARNVTDELVAANQRGMKGFCAFFSSSTA